MGCIVNEPISLHCMTEWTKIKKSFRSKGFSLVKHQMSFRPRYQAPTVDGALTQAFVLSDWCCDRWGGGAPQRSTGELSNIQMTLINVDALISTYVLDNILVGLSDKKYKPFWTSPGFVSRSLFRSFADRCNYRLTNINDFSYNLVTLRCLFSLTNTFFSRLITRLLWDQVLEAFN